MLEVLIQVAHGDWHPVQIWVCKFGYRPTLLQFNIQVGANEL